MNRDLRNVTAVTVDRVVDAFARRHAELPLAPDELETALSDLHLRDSTGAYWALGPWTRRWYRFASGTWAPSPDHPARLEVPVELLRAGEIEVRPAARLDGELVEPPPPERLGPSLLAEVVGDLRARYEAGLIDSETTEELLRQYYLIDAAGRCWTVGFATSDWYWYEAGAWRRCPTAPDPDRVLRDLANLTPELARVVDDFLSTGFGTLPEPVTAAWDPPATFPEYPAGAAVRCARCGAMNAGLVASCLRCAGPLALAQPPTTTAHQPPAPPPPLERSAQQPPPPARRWGPRRIAIVIGVAAVLAVAGTATVSYVADNYFKSPEELFARGENYFHGTYSPRDLGEAVHWYRRAAEVGHPGAQYVLGTLYLEGTGVRVDRAAAISWLQLAARQGHADARALLRRLGESW